MEQDRSCKDVAGFVVSPFLARALYVELAGSRRASAGSQICPLTLV